MIFKLAFSVVNIVWRMWISKTVAFEIALSIFLFSLSWLTSKETVGQPSEPHGSAKDDPFKTTHAVLLGVGLLFQGGFDFLVRLVLTKGVHRPNRGGQPSNQGDLQNDAENSCERSAYREEGQGGEDKCDQKSHVSQCVICSMTTQACLGRLTASFWRTLGSVSQGFCVLFFIQRLSWLVLSHF
jgi:hypothetical protein